MAAVSRQGDNWLLSGSSYSVVLSGANGSILSVADKRHGGRSIISSGEQGLWLAAFSDKTVLAANQAGNDAPKFSAAESANGQSLDLRYSSPDLAVTVTATPQDTALDMRATITAGTKTLLSFSLPGRLRFRPGLVDRFIAPMPSADTVGAQFNGKFFAPQPTDKPTGYQPEDGSDAGYRALYGTPLNMRPMDDPPVTLSSTQDGHRWLGDQLASRFDGKPLVVNRGPAAGQYDLDLIDSPNGPYFSASHLGGSGYLWRITGGSNRPIAAETRLAMLQVLHTLSRENPGRRAKVGLIALDNGPATGGWTDISVDEWRQSLLSDTALVSAGVTVEVLSSADAVVAAARSSACLAIVNPYGEYTPSPQNGGRDATLNAIRDYVRAGGNWFETGGYPFYYALTPTRYYKFSDPYPALFADFFHLETHNGQLSVYRVAPSNWKPFAGATNHDDIFVPGDAGFGGDESGGYLDRSFATSVPAGQTWRTPAVRLKIGSGAQGDIADYCASNQINVPLAQKMSAAVLDRFKASVLVKFNGSCSEQTSNLQNLPSPVIVHVSDYLHGGFDKQYPDILPPNPYYGTAADFRKLIDTIRADGMLSMPYTNTSWWCDHPRGPTLVAAGEAPLLKREDGTPNHEQYGPNDGWTVTFWNEAVQDADLKDVRLFSSDYPVDILFQDQTGARGWTYDYNPVSPAPYAYSEGMISMARRDAALMPLATECGWDRVVNCESEFCGLAWGRTQFPFDECSVFPLAEYIAHDKVAFIQHDLGQSTADQQTMTKLLSLGFGFTYIERAVDSGVDDQREWLQWLSRVQKSVCARYVGQPLVSFTDTKAGDSPSKGELIVSEYGPVRVIANIAPTPATVDGLSLAGSGFQATAPGMVAADLVNTASEGLGIENSSVRYVLEGANSSRDLWVYAARGAVVALPLQAARKLSVQWDGQPDQLASSDKGTVTLTLPATHPRQSPISLPQTLYLWHAKVSGF
jgi:hypothetical protein